MIYLFVICIFFIYETSKVRLITAPIRSGVQSLEHISGKTTLFGLGNVPCTLSKETGKKNHVHIFCRVGKGGGKRGGGKEGGRKVRN